MMIHNLIRKILLSFITPIYLIIGSLFYPYLLTRKLLNMGRCGGKKSSKFWLHGSFLIVKLMFLKKVIVHYNPKILQNDKILLISNHICSLDWYVILLALSSLKKNKNIYFNAKKSLGFLASVLKLYNDVNFVFLKRQLNYDYITLIDSCKILKSEDEYVNVLFPEGTLITRKKSGYINISRSAKRNLPTPKNVMTPKTKGFEIILENLENLDCIVDCTLNYSYKISWWNFIRGKRSIINVYLDYQNIPHNNYSQWLFKIFSDKDDHIESNFLNKNNLLSIDVDMSKKFNYLFYLFFPWLFKKIKYNVNFILRK